MHSMRKQGNSSSTLSNYETIRIWHTSLGLHVQRAFSIMICSCDNSSSTHYTFEILTALGIHAHERIAHIKCFCSSPFLSPAAPFETSSLGLHDHKRSAQPHNPLPCNLTMDLFVLVSYSDCCTCFQDARIDHCI